MRIFKVCVLVAGLSAATLSQTINGAQEPALPYKFKVVEWPTPATSAAGFAAPWNLIQATSAAVTPWGTVLVLHRGAHPLLEFEPGGKFIRSWSGPAFSEGKVAGIPKNDWAPDRSRYSAVYGAPGCDSCGAHSVRVDPQGNVWVVDASAHALYKLNREGKEIMRLGTKGVSGASPTNFNLPTDIGFAPNGDLYVSDGYGGARIVKFTRDGKFLLEWGKRGDGPGEFRLPHNVVVDAQGRVYVTDRDNQRIEVFDGNGRFLTQWKDTGGISGLGITKDGHIWTGAVLRDLSGNVVGRLTDGSGAHGVGVADSGDVYLAQLSGVVQKFVPVP
ncbi:MAG: peptidyl-alpha-hydroxyglycine alpha-amidating lyase family protein [Vicinamibacterales bacterium]|nr:peptidyl-alpha-hydroxyglycine alpha-amidating lyase family protein [Vicinamibacterales bacterium]